MPPTTKPSSSPTPTIMKVTVSGSIDVPIRTDLLGGLQDPVMEAEILKECARLSVSERLGYFDAMDVDIVFDGSGKKQCNVTLDMARLGTCIKHIQGAYEHLLAHAQLLQALLVDSDETPQVANEIRTALAEATLDVEDEARPTTSSARSAKKEANMRALIERMLAGPTSVVEAAAAAATTASSAHTDHSDTNGEELTEAHAAPPMVPVDEADPFNYRSSDPDRLTAGRGLLDADSAEDEDDLDEGDEEPTDYEALGYTRL